MKKCLHGFFGFIVGGFTAMGLYSLLIEQERNQQIRKIDKFKTYYDILNQWMVRKENGETTEEFFQRRNITSIVIYGMGELGARLLKELENSRITVVSCMDTSRPFYYSDGVHDEASELNKADAVVVTAVFAYQEIESKLKKLTKRPILSLEDIILNG